MLVIRQEIDDVLDGKIRAEDSPLKHAPHTADVVTATNWDRVYSRETACYPLPWVKGSKVWPSVGRIDDTYGDRNLVCTCPPLTEYEEAFQDFAGWRIGYLDVASPKYAPCV